MEELISALKILSDPTRSRILTLLRDYELAVHEIIEVLGMTQSAVSNQLAILRKAGFISSRKEGNKAYYSLSSDLGEKSVEALIKETFKAASSTETCATDKKSVKEILDRRKMESLDYFNRQNEAHQANPGDTWEGLSLGLTGLFRNRTIVDMGCGTGSLSRIFAEAGNRVIGIDNSSRQIEMAREMQSSDELDLEFRTADIEDSRLPEESVDLVIYSHSLHHLAQPEAAVREASRILKKEGQILILDLLSYDNEKLKSQYGDFWMGFTEEEVKRWLEQAGFNSIIIRKQASDARHRNITTLIVNAKR